MGSRRAANGVVGWGQKAVYESFSPDSHLLAAQAVTPTLRIAAGTAAVFGQWLRSSRIRCDRGRCKQHPCNQNICSHSPPLSQLILKIIHLTATREPRRIYTPPVKQFENEGGGLKKRGKYQLTEHCAKWYKTFPDASQCDQYERVPGSADDT